MSLLNGSQGSSFHATLGLDDGPPLAFKRRLRSAVPTPKLRTIRAHEIDDRIADLEETML